MCFVNLNLYRIHFPFEINKGYCNTTTCIISDAVFVVACVGGIRKILGKRHYPAGYLIDYAGNAIECQEMCLDNSDECVAVDYVGDDCYEILKSDYSRANLVDDQNSIHYYIVPC